MVMDSNELSWGQQLDKELREKVWEGPGLDVLSRDSQGRALSYKLTHDQLQLLSRTFEKLRYGFQMWRRNDSESDSEASLKEDYEHIEENANLLFNIIDIEMREDYYG